MIRHHWVAFLLIGLFLAMGLAFIPLPGLQNDEALFAGPLYHPQVGYRIRIFGFQTPIMLMSYLGALKTWLYAPWLAVTGPNVWTLRLPMLAAAACTIWVFYRLTGVVAGRMAAIAGVALLATDPCFLLATCFDWGPVALQILLGCCAVLALVRFQGSGSTMWAVVSGLFIGLALWNKALFVWPLTGAVLATLVTAPKSAIRLSAGRGGLCLVAGLVIGASPLIAYNVRARGLTARENVAFDFSDLPGKLELLRYTLEGTGLLGYLISEAPPASPRYSLNAYAFAATLAAIPFLQRRECFRPLVFAVVWMTVTWLLMASTRGAGGAVHHTLLLWPGPAFLIAVVLVEATRRLPRQAVVVGVLTGVLAAVSLAVTLEQYQQLRRNGSPGSWSDAIFRLHDALKSSAAPKIYLMDWGMFDSLLVLGKGRLPLQLGTDPITHTQPDEADRRQLREMLRREGAFFVGHTPGYEEFRGTRSQLEEFALAAGYAKEVEKVISDRNGRPVFEVFRFGLAKR